MEKRNITITIEEAKQWFNSGNATLKKLALQAYNEQELNAFDFTKIKTFQNALLTLYKSDSSEYTKIMKTLEALRYYSKASAAMFKLNIIRKVLNTDYDISLTKNAEGQKHTWYPIFRFITKNCTCYKRELEEGSCEKIGTITSNGTIYDVIMAGGYCNNDTGMGDFDIECGVGGAYINVGLLSCANREIAKHLGKYFGMLIMEAMYGDYGVTTNK